MEQMAPGKGHQIARCRQGVLLNDLWCEVSVPGHLTRDGYDGVKASGWASYESSDGVHLWSNGVPKAGLESRSQRSGPRIVRRLDKQGCDVVWSCIVFPAESERIREERIAPEFMEYGAETTITQRPIELPGELGRRRIQHIGDDARDGRAVYPCHHALG